MSRARGKRVPDKFGIIVPRETGITYVKQGGGMTPQDKTMEGAYISLGKGAIRRGNPEWYNGADTVDEVDLSELPDEELEYLPEYIVERGHFEGHEEYFMWRSQSDHYGTITLYDDLRRFTYGIFDLLDSDPRDRWDDEEQLWEAIDEYLPFTYETYDYYERELNASRNGREPNHPIDADEYPTPEAAIRWITITGPNGDSGREPWASELKGETVLLLCPNAD